MPEQRNVLRVHPFDRPLQTIRFLTFLFRVLKSVARYRICPMSVQPKNRCPIVFPEKPWSRLKIGKSMVQRLLVFFNTGGSSGKKCSRYFPRSTWKPESKGSSIRFGTMNKIRYNVFNYKNIVPPAIVCCGAVNVWPISMDFSNSDRNPCTSCFHVIFYLLLRTIALISNLFFDGYSIGNYRSGNE